MVAKKKEIGGQNGFERLLKYYVKLTPTQFIRQWVTPELKNELLLEIFSPLVTSLNGEKDRPNFQCVYCGGEWSSKLQLFNHRSKGCPNGPIHLGTNKPIFIPMFPNLANAQLLKELKWQIKNNDVSSIQLKLKTQVEVDVEIALEKALINGEHIHVQVCTFKSFKELLPDSRYNRQCQKCA
jgi:hypothetical protein